MRPDRTQPPAVSCPLQGNSSGLTHAASPQSRLTPLHPRVLCRGPPPHLQGNSSGLTHARRRSPDSPLCTLECPAEALLRTFKVIVLDPRMLQTHATNVAAVPTQPPAPPSASGPGPAFTAAPTMRYGSAFSGNTNPNARRPGAFQVPPAPTP